MNLLKGFSLALSALSVPCFLLQQPGVPLNNRQYVVEIVCDAGGKLADRFHLLCLTQLALENGFLGNVLCDQQRVKLAAK